MVIADKHDACRSGPIILEDARLDLRRPAGERSAAHAGCMARRSRIEKAQSRRGRMHQSVSSGAALTACATQCRSQREQRRA